MKTSRSENIKGIKLRHKGNLTKELNSSYGGLIAQLKATNIPTTTSSVPNGTKKYQEEN